MIDGGGGNVVNAGDTVEEEKQNLATIKLSLNTIIRDEHAERVSGEFFDRSVRMTKIAFLASHLFLYKVNRACETDDPEFFDKKGKDVIKDCFRAVLEPNIDDEELMPAEFRDLIEQNSDEPGGFTWPVSDL